MKPVRDISSLHEHGSVIVPFDVGIVNGSVDLLQTAMQGKMRRELTAVKGTIAELWLAMYLLRHGYEPYMPLPGRSARHDMLAVHRATNKVMRVQVRALFSKKSARCLTAPSNQIYVRLQFFDSDHNGNVRGMNLPPVVAST